MAETTIRDFRSDDYPALAELWRTVHVDSPFTAEELEREDRTLPERYRWARVVAEVDGVFAGAGMFDQNPGMYHPQIFSVDIMVAPEQRGHGIGSRLHDRLLAMLESYDPIKRFARIDAADAAALHFATGRGYRETKRDVISVLDLERFEPAAWQNAIDAATAQGLALVSLADILGDADKIRAYYDFFGVVRADVPRSMPATPIEFDFFVSEVVELPETVPGATFLLFDGPRCVGFTQVYSSDATAELQTGLSGIDRAYRRRGLALAVKAQSLCAAKAAGAPRIRTDNDARNVGMMAVNAKLGFVQRSATITLAWEASAVAPV